MDIKAELDPWELPPDKRCTNKKTDSEEQDVKFFHFYPLSKLGWRARERNANLEGNCRSPNCFVKIMRIPVIVKVVAKPADSCENA
jgi:hypothetical protein